MSRPILLIDNLDSFTFNLVDAFQRLGSEVSVLRNTVSAHDAFARAAKDGAQIVLSPGPGGPEDAGCCLELIALARGRVPVLGICLGHQAIAAEAGAAVVRAPEPVHGRADHLVHDGTGAFAGLPSPMAVARYHSLATVDLPPRLRVTASSGGVVMAVHDPDARQIGLQFHPESILTPLGDQILANILAT